MTLWKCGTSFLEPDTRVDGLFGDLVLPQRILKWMENPEEDWELADKLLASVVEIVSPE